MGAAAAGAVAAAGICPQGPTGAMVCAMAMPSPAPMPAPIAEFWASAALDMASAAEIMPKVSEYGLGVPEL